jgi:hypothetical protein
MPRSRLKNPNSAASGRINSSFLVLHCVATPKRRNDGLQLHRAIVFVGHQLQQGDENLSRV